VRAALVHERSVDELRAALAVVVHRAERLAHAVLGDHRPRDVGGALQVVARAGRDLAERDLLGAAPAEQHGQLGLQVAAAHQVAILERQLHRVAERAEAAADDRDLVHRVEVRQQAGDDGVARLVERHDAALLVAHERASSRARR
jgi:hypothetical protein